MAPLLVRSEDGRAAFPGPRPHPLSSVRRGLNIAAYLLMPSFSISAL
jgi:hypothetical protein